MHGCPAGLGDPVFDKLNARLAYGLMSIGTIRGIEIDEKAIYQCVAKGLTVSHGDIDSGLTDFSSKRFDYVILNESLQHHLFQLQLQYHSHHM